MTQKIDIANLKVTPPGVENALYCPKCGKHITRYAHNKMLTWGDTYTCQTRGCGYTGIIDEWEASISPDCLQFLDNKTIRFTKWYHVTPVLHWSDWVQNSPTVQVHLGTLKTVKHYKRFAYKKTKTKIFEITLRSNVSLDDSLYADIDHWSSIKKNIKYLNIWEGPGQVSLMVRNGSIKTIRELGENNELRRTA